MDSTDEFELVAELTPGSLKIRVTDHGRSKKAPRAQTAEYQGPGGMGLRVVQAIAQRWGAERLNGMHVWAELAI
jgi:anti-sigma regulatory factor (Ser/Thr protein kinase)